MSELNGAQILLRSLVEEGVDTIFGYPGGAVIDIFDAMAREFSEDFKFILTRHEQAAVHAADGYARATGKPGICIVTSGPGGTNTVTGLATACMDSIPVIVFTGQVPTPLIGNDAFQEADIVGITRPCTKHNYLVSRLEDLAQTIKEAFVIASTGRPGPVLVDLPKDIVQAKTEFEYPKTVSLPTYKPTIKPYIPSIKRAAAMLAEAKKPVIYAGGGVITAEAHRELTELAEMMGFPVTMTLMGLGCFPGTHPLSLGMLGMHGTYRANMAVSNSDLLLAVGARFDDRVTGKIEEFAPQAKIIHIDIDPTSIQKNLAVDVPIVADAKNALAKLIEVLKKKGYSKNDRRDTLKEWHVQLTAWRNEQRLRFDRTTETIKPQYVVEKLYELTADRAIITTEVGQNQMWAAQYYLFDRPRTFLTSGGLGTMGYGFPAAIGAQVAFPDKIVIDIAGDGSIQMNIQELATVAQYHLPVKIAILNNGYLGMVRQWQERFYDNVYAHTDIMVAPDFVKLAEAYGAVGLRATTTSEVEPTIRKALEIDGPVIIDFVVEREEGVYPMVPAGASLTNMILI
ncbi:biosynthetic-type acetolactate synthase large subunit [Desulfomonile tiedjei]|uniref:Acetolactate synthase n=1 Tax=Desulfomonile tiedjei (strain ATCC 49306 / DSM 6799 / DCB-1) TaxID=706587 RepID=I4BZR0_DESTA|nr:biosynthetic-type acetolactate synthase large subunit [Desulfomonile tiedjei]AFM22801.1 acetolactate synthase, large subunit [Desulfomonile tiedjei DSM 6799]